MPITTTVDRKEFFKCLAAMPEWGDKMHDFQIRARAHHPLDQDGLTEELIDRIGNSKKLPFTFKPEEKRVTRLEFTAPSEIASIFRYSSDQVRLDSIKGGVSKPKPKTKEDKKWVKGLSVDGAGQFFSGNPNWALAKVFKVLAPSGKEVVDACILYSPQDRTLFYSIGGHSYCKYADHKPIEMKAPPLDVAAASLLPENHSGKVIKLKACIGNHHRGPSTHTKAIYQETLGRDLHLSFQDLSSMDYPLALLSVGTLSLSYIGSADQKLSNCRAGLCLAENAGYAITIFKTTFRSQLDALQNRELYAVIASHPAIHDVCVANYLKTVQRNDSDIVVTETVKTPGMKMSEINLGHKLAR